jgi:hypothetical protein
MIDPLFLTLEIVGGAVVGYFARGLWWRFLDARAAKKSETP